MAFTINTRRLPYLQNYQQCKDWFDKTQPGRSGYGWMDYERPLDTQRMHHKRLVHNKTEDSYSCVLYETELVTYACDGWVQVRLHDSMSSSMFLHHMLPPGIRTFRPRNRGTYKGSLMLEVDTPERTEWYVSDGFPFLLEKNRVSPHSWTVVTGYQQRHRETLDRRKLNETIKDLKRFKDWFVATERIAGPGYKYRADPKVIHKDDIKNPETWVALSRLMYDESLFDDAIYQVQGARVITPIPNCTPPKTGRLGRFT